MYTFKGIRVYTQKEKDKYGLDAREILQARDLYLSDNVKQSEIYNLYLKTFDYAVPQNWYEDYKKQYGYYPRAVWSYDDTLFGKPVFFDDLYARFGRELQSAINAGEIQSSEID